VVVCLVVYPICFILSDAPSRVECLKTDARLVGGVSLQILGIFTVLLLLVLNPLIALAVFAATPLVLVFLVVYPICLILSDAPSRVECLKTDARFVGRVSLQILGLFTVLLLLQVAVILLIQYI
jgi:bacteriorhodopsin